MGRKVPIRGRGHVSPEAWDTLPLGMRAMD